MTDIETLRQAVIDAAVTWRKTYGDPIAEEDADTRLIEAVDRLDFAMRPDPWQLLEEVYDHGETDDVLKKINAALAWHREHDGSMTEHDDE